MSQFTELVALLRQHVQEPVLNAPASPLEVAGALMTDIPALQELRDAYIVGNGQTENYLIGNGESDICHPAAPVAVDEVQLFGDFFFMNTEGLRDNYNLYSELLANGDLGECEATSHPPGAVKHVPFSKGWIPFAEGDEEYLCVDLTPGPAGCVGQVILFAGDVDHLFKVADSFEEFCGFMITLYKSGEMHRQGLYKFLCARAGL
ncbi:MAG: SMI1/KNR4 family protein [Pseudomonadales bacterium]